MSADQPLTGDELATIKARVDDPRHITFSSGVTIKRLVAEIERLQAKVERVEAVAVAWDETPDYTPSNYDSGRVDQRHDMALELLTLLASG